MKITLQPTASPGPHRNPTVTLATEYDYHTVEEVFEQLIIPALLAWGFTEETIDLYLEEQ